MRFKSILISEGLLERYIDFNPGENLLFSMQNTQGKTTLVRLLLYGLGYAIPSTKGLRFKKLSVRLVIESERFGEVALERFGEDGCIISYLGQESIVSLPNDFMQVQEVVFGCDNHLLLSNLLATYYIDQEKGWTLLNRGKAIADNSFSIEAFISSLSGLDYESFKSQLMETEKQIEKIETMKVLAGYRKALLEESEPLQALSEVESVQSEIHQMKAELDHLKKEKQRASRVLKRNEFIRDYISDMRLRIRDSHGEELVVTPENVVGLDFSVNILHERVKFLSGFIKEKEDALFAIEREVAEANDLPTDLFPEVNDLKYIDAQLIKIPMKPDAFDSKLEELRNERIEIGQELKNTLKRNNNVFDFLAEQTRNYLERLQVCGITDSWVPSYVLTNKLREFSGADFHKTVFAFRMAYIKTVQEFQGINLPIIIDSPGGTEITKENLKLMEQVLQSDFSDHQIIIASVERFDDWEGIHRIEIEYPLLRPRGQSEDND